MDANAKNLILKNVLSMLSIRVFTPVATFSLFIFISRILGPAELGKYSLILVLYLFTQFFPLLGLQSYVIREISKDRSFISKFLWNLLPVGLAASFAVGALTASGVYLLHYPREVVLAAIILIAGIAANTTASFCELVWVGCEKMSIMALVTLLENILKLTLSIAGILGGRGLLYLTLVLCLTRLVSAGLYLWILARQFPETGRGRFDPLFCKSLFKVCPVFFAILFCTMLLQRVDFLMLSKLGGFEALGFYSTAYRLMESMTLLSSTFIFAVFPVMSRLHHSDPSGLQNLTKKATKYLFITMLLLSGITVFASEKLIPLFYGHAYLPAAGALKILSGAALFTSLDQVFTGLLLAANHQKEDLKILSISALVYLLLLTMLIPRFGFYGASSATVLTYLIQTGLSYAYVRKLIFNLPLFQLTGRTVLAGAGMILAGSLVPHWGARLAAAFTVYMALLFILKVVRWDELGMMLPSSSRAAQGRLK